MTRPCPACGSMGREVTPLTLDEHVPAPLREELGDAAAFCPSPGCEAVYFNARGTLVRKVQTRLPVAAKDPGDDVLVCYCFQHKRGDLRRGLKEKGNTDIPDRIRRGIQEGRCDCERRNPHGACCLGDVAAVIGAIQAAGR